MFVFILPLIANNQQGPKKYLLSTEQRITAVFVNTSLIIITVYIYIFKYELCVNI